VGCLPEPLSRYKKNMELSTRFNPAEVEDKWYKYWEEKRYFHSEPDHREPFTIIIPPPNVTGVLHMGHMLNNTIQDILIRKARLDGKNACWVPGTDHASIATEAKVVRKLREEGIKKSDLSREEFLKHAWDWTDKYGGIILQQLKKLGASCDWERTAFTMDETRSDGVIKVFVDLYKKDKLYRGLRMVNWDPEAQTVLSNEEVLHSDEQSKLYHIKYKIEGTEEYLVVATKRPETIMGDSGLAVNPKDERYTHLKGKRVIVPLINKSVPIIFDDYVDIEFGTGALKVTPAHDPNDYEIGKRHNLEVVETIDPDGRLNEKAQLHIGKDRFEARKLVTKDLDAAGLLVEIEDYTSSIGRSERTNAVVEPMLSLQWYVDMKTIADPGLKSVMEDEIQFFPEKFKNTYRHWMENIRDWCISRQLWWGHRIPAWYYGDEVFVAETADEALSQAREKLNNPALKIEDLKQDDDVLDTWFSSWLWPITVFDGFRNQKEIDYYYPTSVLVTGWDIIFLWVARMIMAGYEWKNTFPYKHVYFTGMVRDQQRRKMSKSLGNSPDALKLIEDFGADGVRFGMLSCSPAGGDLLFDDKLCDQGKKFCNKIWNALNLTKTWEIDNDIITPIANWEAIKWFESLQSKAISEIESNMSEYRLSEALISLYSFIWNDYCSWFLEMIKPAYQKPIDPFTYKKVIQFFSSICTMLHPFMPFITEEVWHELKERSNGEDCIISKYPKPSALDEKLLQDFEILKDATANIRDVRNKQGLKMRDPLKVFASDTDETKRFMERQGGVDLLKKMAVLEKFEIINEEPENSVNFISGKSAFYVVVEKEIDKEAELIKLKEDLKYQEGFVNSVGKKLSNERFVNNAPAAVVEKEKKKLSDGQARIEEIQSQIEKLNK